jgi:hypothetical protein
VVVAIESHQGALDMQITTIGLDIAKNVFQVHENHLGKAFMKMNFSGPQFQFIPAPPIPTPPPAAESPLPAPPATPPEAALQASLSRTWLQSRWRSAGVPVAPPEAIRGMHLLVHA